MSAIFEISKTDKKYAAWLWALKLFGEKWFGWTEKTEPCPKSWRHFYDDNIKPLDALKIDLKESK